MPRGKEFCPLENDYFDLSQFEVVDGTRVHNVEPLHRATDGVLVHKKNDKLFPVAERMFTTLSKRKP